MELALQVGLQLASDGWTVRRLEPSDLYLTGAALALLWVVLGIAALALFHSGATPAGRRSHDSLN